MLVDLPSLGWDATWDGVWREAVATAGADAGSEPARVRRIDRGWSSLLPAGRVRNLGAEVAVGDWVVPSADGERVERVLPRRSAFVRRASHEGARGESQPLAANIDVVLLVHTLTAPLNQRRLERELVLAYDSGAAPVIVLTKADLVDDPGPAVADAEQIALTVPVQATSGRSGFGLEALVELAAGHRTIALLGASGVGKSTLVNALVGREVQDTGAVRSQDDRGRHTTTAAELVGLPGGGWLIDTPGLRAVSLWASGQGIERAFQDVFDLADRCRFRDCKHEGEPGCAVLDAVAAGQLDPRRVESMKRLVAEEAALEAEQVAKERATDRRGVRRPVPRR